MGPDLAMRPLLLVAAGAVVGGLARYLVSGWLTREDFPWGTFAVNLSGSFVIGVFMFGGIAKGWFGPDARLFFAVGVLGAYTTMSSFAFETVSFLDDREWLKAGANFLLNPVLCVAGCWLGRGVALLVPPGGG